MLALYTAASGMAAMEKNVEVISNNIANTKTTGYKRQSAQFQDLLYEINTRAGSSSSGSGTMLPAGIEIGTGVRLVSTVRTMSQGSITASDRNLDIAISGNGYFRIQRSDGTIGYTRDGSFTTDAQGQLVTSKGYVVDPGITIPPTAMSISISAAGLVQVKLPAQATPQDVGKIQLTHFANETGLEATGDNLFAQTAASGDPVTADPGTDGLGELQQGYLEEANVNAVSEISSLITAQRSYEMNSRVVTAADQMQQTTTQMFKG